jgi:DNA-binding NtrC family response regulator
MSERTPRILAIDDDSLWLSQIPEIFDSEFEVTTCETIDQGISALESSYFDIVLLDLNFNGDSRTGFDVFKRISALDSSVDVIVLSGETKPERLIQIINAGVTKFLPKPSTPREIREAVRDTLDTRSNRFNAVNLAKSNSNSSPGLIGSSWAMQKLREQIAQAVVGGAKDILLIGETGTGKEVVARTIATQADPAKRLIPIHCGAISEGIAESELFGHVKGAFTGADRDRASAFEAVGGGYVFLDEIGEMPLHQQAKLLRVLQERKVQRVGSSEERITHFRCITATNLDLPKAIEERRFREDLYYRIARLTIEIPTLRSRSEDVSELVKFFLAREGANVEITFEAATLLAAYPWPGNVRQLQSVVELLSIRCKDRTIREKDIFIALPELSQMTGIVLKRSFMGRQGSAFVLAEKRRFQSALDEARGDRTRAAELLNISRATFFRRAKDLGLVSTRTTWNV